MPNLDDVHHRLMAVEGAIAKGLAIAEAVTAPTIDTSAADAANADRDKAIADLAARVKKLEDDLFGSAPSSPA